MKQIAFVCSGNTCRSPMAEYLFRDMYKKEGMDFGIISRGLGCRENEPMNRESAATLKRYSANIEDPAKHVSKALSVDDLIKSDFIFTMEFYHKKKILEEETLYYREGLSKCEESKRPELERKSKAWINTLNKKIMTLKTLKGEPNESIQDPYPLITHPIYKLYIRLLSIKNKTIRKHLLKLLPIMSKAKYLPDYKPFGPYKARIYDNCRNEIKENLDVLLEALKK